MRTGRLLASVILLCGAAFPSFAGRTDRGVASFKTDSVFFARKGSIIAGGSLALSNTKSGDFDAAVIRNANCHGYSVNVRPAAMYCIADDLAVGICGIYRRSLTDIASASLGIESLSLDVEDYYALGHKYGGAVFLRKYMPLGRSGRFSLFVDVQAEFLGGQSKITNKRNETVSGTYQTSSTFGLGVNPGVAAYITEHFALGVGLGIVGIEFNRVRQEHNHIDNGTRNAFSASYNLNLLSLSLSAYYCF